MTEIGNWAFASHSTQGYIRAFQTNPKLTHDVIAHKDGIDDIRPGVTITFQNINIDRPNMTDLVWIKSRFDSAVNYKNSYHYGVFLLYEELMSPAQRAAWLPGSSGVSTWITAGTLDIGGQHLELIETWHRRVYGTWDTAWWSGIRAGNKYNDAKVTAWDREYQTKLYKAWHAHMKTIGKKSSICGIIGMFGDGLSTFKSFFPTCWQWIADNYDAVIAYRYPKMIGAGIDDHRGTDQSGIDVHKLRPIIKGKLFWILTACFPKDNNTCPFNLDVAKEEYKQVAPYVDVILVTPYADMTTYPGVIEYPPLLIKMWDLYNPTPDPGCIPDWKCELPLNGYESDGCGNRRLSSACNVKKYKCSGAPFYQCTEDPTGEYDTLDACNTACVTQRPALSSIIVTPGMATITVGESIVVVGTAIDSQGVTMGGVPIVWTSDPAGIVEIDPVNTATFIDGKISTKIKGISPGMCIIKGTSGSVSGQLILDVNVAPPLPPGIKWKYSGAPDCVCIEDPAGTFDSQSECQAACKKIDSSTKDDEKVVLAVIAALSFLR